MNVRSFAAIFAAFWATSPLWMFACTNTTIIQQIVPQSDATFSDADLGGNAEAGVGGQVDTGLGNRTGPGGPAKSDASPGSSADAGKGADCGRPPKLLDAGAVGLHCPNVAEGGLPAECPAGDHCCEQSSPSGKMSTCASSCSGTDAEADWACQDPSQCPGIGMVCCGTGIVMPVAGCGYATVLHFLGTHCARSCLAAEFAVCEHPNECPSGHVCMPAKAHGGTLGACQ
jgi:hypothetical protein